MEYKSRLDLHLFDGSAAASDGDTGGALSPELTAELDKIAPPTKGAPEAKPTAQETQTDPAPTADPAAADDVAEPAPVDRAAEFEKLIKGEYKDVFDQRVNGIIGKKTKENAAIKGRLGEMSPIMDKLFMRYGVADGDYTALSEALDADTNYVESQAAQMGVDVATFTKLRQAEHQASVFARQNAEAERRQKFDNMMNDLRTKSETVKQKYPGFDFDTEMQNTDFADLVFKGVDVGKVYELMHHDEIMSGAMAYTAQKTAKNVVDGIKAKGMRPMENGSSGSAGVAQKTDVSKMTDKDIDDILRRVQSGEEIRF